MLVHGPALHLHHAVVADHQVAVAKLGAALELDVSVPLHVATANL